LIQKIFFQLFRTAFKTTEMLFPVLAGKWAVRLFFTPRKFKRPNRELNFLKDARVSKIPFRSDYKMGIHEDYYIRYEWGNAGPAVLLVHGWEGRGSQMGHFVKPLLEAGYRVISFDALAHGDSPGKRTNMLEFARIIGDIDRYAGGFHAIIGHSLGGTAAGYAIAEGVRAHLLITICSPTTIEFIFNAFAEQICATQVTVQKLSQFLEDFTGKRSPEFSFVNFATKVAVPGLIIHDQDDKEISHSQAIALQENWMGSELLLTNGLGHKRVLINAEIISKIMDFIRKVEKENKLRHAGLC
jgi:pimeloyl-ACP methyl ester carboxylesterase